MTSQLSKSSENNIYPIKDEYINLSWIPDTPVDLTKSILENTIIEYTNSDLIQSKIITITFISGIQLIVIYDFQKLCDLKYWLNSLINFHNDNDNNYYIDFIINSNIISNTIGILLDQISEISCIITKKKKIL